MLRRYDHMGGGVGMSTIGLQIGEIDVDVEYDYQPEERDVNVAENATITEISINGEDHTHYFKEFVFTKLESEILELI